MHTTLFYPAELNPVYIESKPESQLLYYNGGTPWGVLVGGGQDSVSHEHG